MSGPGNPFRTTPRPNSLGARRRLHAVENFADEVVPFVPRRFPEIVIAYDEGSAGEELLVLQVATRELRAGDVPRQLEQLHPVERAHVGRLPMDRKIASHGFIL